jgi:hypothetical protein
MSIRAPSYAPVVAAPISVFILLALASALPAQQLNATEAVIQELIDMVKTTASSSDRQDLADRLLRAVRIASPTDISTATVINLAELLDNDDDWVRIDAAASLANIGPRARPAVPMLRRALQKVQLEQSKASGLAVFGGLTSGETICLALREIGDTPLPSVCVNGPYGYG